MIQLKKEGNLDTEKILKRFPIEFIECIFVGCGMRDNVVNINVNI